MGVASVKAFVRQNGGAIPVEFVEVKSGKRSNRPELAKAVGLGTAQVRWKWYLLRPTQQRLARVVDHHEQDVCDVIGIDLVARKQELMRPVVGGAGLAGNQRVEQGKRIEPLAMRLSAGAVDDP